MASTKKKLVSTVAAVATSAALLLGGTLAWQSTNQVALNEASDVINPGGRLHDDFDGENKDVYVENFTDPNNGGEDIFARVRLEEYFEIVTNYKTEAERVHTLVGNATDAAADAVGSTDNTGESIVNIGEKYSSDKYERTYATHIFTEENVASGDAAVDADGNAWWKWTLGGQTDYMPTYNLNKDSLMADVNGKFDGAVGTITDRDATDPDAQYTADRQADFPYVEYTAGDTAEGFEVFDGDPNNLDEVESQLNLKDMIENGTELYPDNIVLSENKEVHTAATTLEGSLMSMAQWIADGSQPGPYWVYDTDGWVYWAQAIEPGTATGLLLDGIELNQVMDDTWYYAINVIAQFVTADDVGKFDNTGFYDTNKGSAPTGDAETLLEKIGVNMSDAPADDQPGEEEPTAEVASIAMTEGGVESYTGVPHPLLALGGGNTITLAAYDAEGKDVTADVNWSSGSANVTVNGGLVSTAADAAMTSTTEEVTITAASANGTSATYSVYLYNDAAHVFNDSTVIDDSAYLLFTPAVQSFGIMDDTEPMDGCVYKQGSNKTIFMTYELGVGYTQQDITNVFANAYIAFDADPAASVEKFTYNGLCPHGDTADEYTFEISDTDGIVQSGDTVNLSLYKNDQSVSDATYTLTADEGVTLQSGTAITNSTLEIADKEGIFNANKALTVTALVDGEEVASEQLTIKPSTLSMELSVENYYRAYPGVANAVTLDTNSIEEKETGAALTVDELNFQVTGYTVTKNGQDVTADVFDADAMTFTANDAAFFPNHVKFIITANYTTDPLGAGSVSTEVKAEEYQLWADKGTGATYKIPRARGTMIWDSPDGVPQEVYEVQYLNGETWTTSENSVQVLFGGGSGFQYFYFYTDREPAMLTADAARIIMKGDESQVRYYFEFLN